MADDGLDPGRDAERMFQAIGGRFFGKYRGLVVSNTDPTSRGRLQVQAPAVMGEESVWAAPCVPYAGDSVGFFALPPVGAGVWVEFEAGDPSYPIWTGCYWTDGQIDAADALPTVKFFKTDAFTLRIDDAQGEMVIETATGSRITINATEIKLEALQVTQSAQGCKTALTPASFDVNDGTFTVLPG
ncbi:phage baseplate assembly protein V [Limobrevibacterium gyesilva]|uniref:Phage baseplate assembly protein V n=1 Tax=Limobrevibacterium gyesilva TaxID=2991712 RepID=A0AA41YML7_9PROT|nr:phage baseplate assembly protein V [Limobrevibacterium gyesilva]MCW3475301.1 phage baseplate assembly protein V [Limobrevibacterium gyesilva]